MKPLALSGIFGFLFLAASFSLGADDTALRRYAFFLGANNGGAERVQLRYAETDSRSLAQVMTDVGGIAPDDSILEIDPLPARVDDIFQEMASRISLAKDSSRRVEFLFYYSGHSNEEGLLLGEEVYGYRHLKDRIKDLDADVSVVILDSCSSGTFTRLKGGVQQPSFLMDDSSFMSGHAFLTSSSENEAAQESDRIGASFFTHNLVTGLRGAADHSGDGRVTLNEAYHYAFAETLAQTEKTQAGPQHPSYDIQLTGKGDLVLTDLNTPIGRITLGPYVSGRLFVRSLNSSDQPLVAELSKAAGKPLTLALSPGSYRVSMVDQGRRFVKDVTLSDFGQTPVSWADFEERQSYETVVRGDKTIPARGEKPMGPGSVGDDEIYVPLGFSWAGQAFMPQAGKTVNDFGLALLISRVKRVNVLQTSGVLSIHHDDLSGLQASGVVGLVDGSISGFQCSGVVNYTAGLLEGFQTSGVVNISGEVDGFQVAGTANVALGPVNGVQVSGVYNQSADLKGIQVGLVNVAGDVEGIQLGLVNIAGERDGLVLGLVNVQKNGLLHGQTWADGAGWGYAGFQSGSRHVYTLIYGGGDVDAFRTGSSGGLGSGLGLGVHGNLKPLYWEADVSGFTYLNSAAVADSVQNDTALTSDDAPTYLVLRGQVGLALGRLGLFAGAMSFVVFPGQPDLPGRSWDYTYAPGDGTGVRAVKTSLFAGVRF